MCLTINDETLTLSDKHKKHNLNIADVHENCSPKRPAFKDQVFVHTLVEHYSLRSDYLLLNSTSFSFKGLVFISEIFNS